MPATTPTRFPYPLGTDPVADGDDAIKALAQAIPQIQSGTATIPAGAVDGVALVTVTFPRAFAAVPAVVVSSLTPHPTNYQMGVWVGTITTTTVVLAARLKVPAAVNVAWFAASPPVTP